jgi:chemotaxis response regulator CheB
MKVLIVDDSVLLRKRLVAALSEIECVEIAGEISDGLEAIDAARKLNPDVMILDIRSMALRYWRRSREICHLSR